MFKSVGKLNEKQGLLTSHLHKQKVARPNIGFISNIERGKVNRKVMIRNKYNHIPPSIPKGKKDTHKI